MQVDYLPLTLPPPNSNSISNGSNGFAIDIKVSGYLPFSQSN